MTYFELVLGQNVCSPKDQGGQITDTRSTQQGSQPQSSPPPSRLRLLLTQLWILGTMLKTLPSPQETNTTGPEGPASDYMPEQDAALTPLPAHPGAPTLAQH